MLKSLKMKNINRKIMKLNFLLLSLLLIYSCIAQENESQNQNTKENFSTGEFDLTDTTYFELVKNYIRENGKERKQNASSNLSKEFIVTYYSVDVEEMKISIDHSERIYMNLNSVHYGNILKENGTVVPEINYGVADKNPQETKEKQSRFLAVYRELIVLALKN